MHFVINSFMRYSCLSGIRVLSRDCLILGCDSSYTVVATICLDLEMFK